MFFRCLSGWSLLPIFGSVKDADLDGKESGDDDVRNENEKYFVHGGFGENGEGD